MQHLWTALMIVMLTLGGVGWVQLLFSYEQVERHERILMKQAGGLVDHERRLQSLERALGQDPDRSQIHPTFGDLVCSDASHVRRPMLGDR